MKTPKIKFTSAELPTLASRLNRKISRGSSLMLPSNISIHTLASQPTASTFQPMPSDELEPLVESDDFQENTSPINEDMESLPQEVPSTSRIFKRPEIQLPTGKNVKSSKLPSVKMTIKAKLSASFGVMIAIIIFLGIFSLFNMSTLGNS